MPGYEVFDVGKKRLCLLSIGSLLETKQNHNLIFSYSWVALISKYHPKYPWFLFESAISEWLKDHIEIFVATMCL